MPRVEKPNFRGRDFNHSLPINFGLQISEEFGTLLDKLARDALTREGRQIRDKNFKQTRAALACLCANLVRVHRKHADCFLAISLNRNDYTPNRYQPLSFGYSAFKRAVNHLADIRFVLQKDGFKDRGTGVGKSTRLLPTDWFRLTFPLRNGEKAIEQTGLKESENKGENEKEEAKGDLEDPTGLPILITKTKSLGWADLTQTSTFEEIHLKDEHKKLIPYDETANTEAMRQLLQKWNAFLNEHWIDLFLTDKDFSKPLNAWRGGNESPENNEDHAFSYPGLDFSRTRLYRVFNNGSFEEGGRFYGGWWQEIPSALRPYVTIDWHPTREVDFSSMLPMMLYALEGKELAGDAYALDGIGPEYRPLIKRTMVSLINALPEQPIRQPDSKELPGGVSWQELTERIRERHREIERRFRTGIGLKLQKKDADIAQEIMQRLSERGIPVLPVHDSFLIRDGYVLRLRDTMQEVYDKHMGQGIGTKLTRSAIERGIAVGSEGPSKIETIGSEEIREALSVEKERLKGPYSLYYKRKNEVLAAWPREKILRINPTLP